ncbi:MAG: DNA repair protein RecO [Clostridia bacterium]|nr:DNA repair protein RecO [Clostridia bacterium]
MASNPKQHLMTDGLIVRDYDTLTEADRFVAILTRDKGLLRASAKGARNMKSRSGAGTQLLSYSKLSLIPARDKYIVEDAVPQEVFFSLRQDVEGLALAQYFCELALHLTPTDSPAPEHLRLLLNALHFLCEGKKDPLLIKAVVEGRLLSLEGYMPDLSSCARCGCEEGECFWFSPAQGTITCDNCGREEDALPVSAGVLAALRHIIYGDFERCFSFSLPREDVARLATIMERFLLAQQPRHYATLDFFHTLAGGT